MAAESGNAEPDRLACPGAGCREGSLECKDRPRRGFLLIALAPPVPAAPWSYLGRDRCCCVQVPPPRMPQRWAKAAYFSECIWPAHVSYKTSVFGDAHVLGQAGKSSAYGGRTLCLQGSVPGHRLASTALRALRSWEAEGCGLSEDQNGRACGWQVRSEEQSGNQQAQIAESSGSRVGSSSARRWPRP